MTKQLIFSSPYWWPTIDKVIKYHAQDECEECMLETDTKQEDVNLKEKLTTTLKEISPLDWRRPYIE